MDKHQKLQKFLMQNSLYYCTVYYHYDHLLSKEVVDWFEENSEDFEENFDSERAMFRTLMAGVLCNLRQEGFWKEQGLEKLYVIPFEGEDELPFEEKVATCHHAVRRRHHHIACGPDHHTVAQSQCGKHLV